MVVKAVEARPPFPAPTAVKIQTTTLARERPTRTRPRLHQLDTSVSVIDPDSAISRQQVSVCLEPSLGHKLLVSPARRDGPRSWPLTMPPRCAHLSLPTVTSFAHPTINIPTPVLVCVR